MFETTRVRAGAGRRRVLVRSDEAGVSGYDIMVDARACGRGDRGAARRRRRPRERRGRREAVRIESGRPRFGVDMDTDTIPLEAGLEERAISRSKGCYVGQEVIVRVQDRGQGRVAKRLVGLTFDAGAPVPPAGARDSVGGARDRPRDQRDMVARARRVPSRSATSTAISSSRRRP